MAYKVYFEDSAEADLYEAIEYHLQYSTSKAERLILEVDKLLKLLEKKPYFRIRYDNVRCLPLAKKLKLPYMLHFVVDEKNKNIYVFALFNTLQHPEKYPKR